MRLLPILYRDVRELPPVSGIDCCEVLDPLKAAVGPVGVPVPKFLHPLVKRLYGRASA